MADRWANSFSSSSEHQHQWNYDVYFSFRGVDTRRNFIAQLYNAFWENGIHALIDDEELKAGEELSQALIKGSEQSRISIIAFSENYASSTWCLDELVNFINCMKTSGQLVFPVFYNVDASAVRHQRGSFGSALARQELRFKVDSGRVQRWRWALFKAANISSWDIRNGYEYKFTQQIIQDIISRLKRNFPYSADIPGKHFKGFEFQSISCMDLRESELLRIPDMSAAQNLTKLLLDSCINLVEIHNSVGFLGKLVTLSAKDCRKLKRFPRRIRLMSLQHLYLGGNYSLQFFPEVLEKMENIREVRLEKTAIRELTSSMGNLIGLRLLQLNHCSIRKLPRTFRMLINLTEISMAYCPRVFQSLKSNINFGKLRYSLVQKLNLERCDLLDEDLLVIVHSFPNTKYLDLSKNKFVSISAYIKELYCLEKLNLDNCKLLEQIEEIPPKLVLLSAINCNRLTSESINLLGLAHQESSDKRFEVKLPGTKIPECFNHHVGEGKMSFLVREDFPDVALCLAFELKEEQALEGSFHFTCDVWIQVNRLPILEIKSYRERQTSHHHVQLIRLHSYIDDFRNVGRYEWNHVKIFWEVKYYDQTPLNMPRPGRVHIYGKEADMEDIPFKKDKIPSISPNGGSFSQTTNDDESKTYDSQSRDCSISQITYADECETYHCLVRDNKRKPCYRNREEDLSIGLLRHCSQYDPVTLVCESIWTKDNDSSSHDQFSSFPDEKCSNGSQANEADMILDPMELEYKVSCQKDQRSNREKGNDERMGSNQESQRWFSLCVLISSLVSLCSSCFLSSPWLLP